MTLTLSNYRILRQLHKGTASSIYRAQQRRDGQVVILKVLNGRYPSSQQLSRLEDEFQLLHALELPGVITAYRLESADRQHFMVLEDFGGQPLVQLPSASHMAITDFLNLALKITNILEQLHQQHIIHQDINPAHILLNPDDGQVKLIDFDLATQLSNEKSIPANPDALRGTLAYISPEQTGRMNRAVDYRTDLYSLGITLYELITGQLPFLAADPLEIVHSHLAHPPLSPQQLRPDLPTVVANIILKLLAKSPEERYQTASGLAADLQKCLSQQQTENRISDFVLGQQDTAGQWQLPSKLYGQGAATAVLLNAFATVGQSPLPFVLIAGRSGVGKSSLVQQVRQPITAANSLFIEGKYDALQRSIPYYGWVQAWQQLVDYWLTESEARLAEWREKVGQAVGENGRVLTELVPKLSLLLGPQPDVPSLAAQEAQNRLHYLFGRFLRVIATAEQPLTIFLDDLQWADAASLNLLKDILVDSPPYLFIIGACRDNEVSATHTLSLMLAETQAQNIPYQQVQLHNLTINEISQLLVDTLGESAETADLAALIHQKTAGNAFFIRLFLQTLYEQQLLQFTTTGPTKRWVWSLEAIKQLSSTTNVVDLLVAKIQTLPVVSQTMLKLAACMGTTFHMGIVALLANLSQQQVAQNLEAALTADILLLTHSQPEEKPYQTAYQFAHDRIHFAAYSLLTPEEQQQIHWQIGNLLWDNATPEERAERPFAILNQWYLAKDLIKDETDLIRFVELSLLAGESAIAPAAYDTVYDYLHLASQLFHINNSHRWQSNYDLMLRLTSAMAELAYLSGRLREAEQFIEVVLEQAHHFLDTLSAIETRIKIYTTQNNLAQAIQVGLQFVAQLGVSVPENLNQTDIEVALADVKEILKDKTIAELINQPEISTAQHQALARIFTVVRVPLYYHRPKQNTFLITRQVQLMLQHGYFPDAGIIFATYAQLLCGIGEDIEAGYRYGQLALQLAEKYQTKISKALTLQFVHSFVSHWHVHIRETLLPLQEAHQNALESGNLTVAIFATSNYCYHAYVAGAELTYLEQQIANLRQLQKQLNQDAVSPVTSIYHQLVLNLMGQAADPCVLTGTVSNEEELFKTVLAANSRVHLSILYTVKLTLYFLFQEPKQALECAVISEAYLESSPGSVRIPQFHFYSALARLAVWSETPAEEQHVLLSHVAASQAKLKQWATHAPMNHLHKWHLVEAERACVLGQAGEAREHYDQAIGLAQQEGYVQDAALACELAARFYLARGQEDFAGLCFQKSKHLYEQWGAAAKVHDLETRYSRFFAQTTFLKGTQTDSIPHMLDMGSIIKASQTLSQEVVLERLLEKMMQIVMENAGADRSVLLLVEGEQWLVQAETVVNHPPNLLQAKPLDTCADLMATAVIYYVRQTQENIVLEDASQSELFRHDAYIAGQQPKSILCLPIQYQGQLKGILYLENNLSSGVFTENRIELLNVLLAQTAISLENARLYGDLTEEIAERKEAEATLRESEIRYRALFERSNDAVLIVNFEGIFIAVNHLAVEMFGYTHTEFVKLHVNDIVDPTEQTDSSDKMAQVLRGESVPIYERRFRRKDGHTFPVELNVALVYDEAGQPLHMQSIVRDITERKQIEAEILASLYEKEVLLKEIHHRVKNNLQVISSLLDLQSDYVTEEAYGMLQDSRSRVRSMALVHEQLYQSADLARIDFADYVHDLTGYLRRAYGNTARGVMLDADVANIAFSVETAVPLGLIVNELVSNAYKHAFVDGRSGQIHIGLQKMKNNQIFLSVQDNGIGFPADIDFRRSPSLGLTIIMTLVDQLGGQVALDRGQGTRFEISFSLDDA